MLASTSRAAREKALLRDWEHIEEDYARKLEWMSNHDPSARALHNNRRQELADGKEPIIQKVMENKYAPPGDYDMWKRTESRGDSGHRHRHRHCHRRSHSEGDLHRQGSHKNFLELNKTRVKTPRRGSPGEPSRQCFTPRGPSAYMDQDYRDLWKSARFRNVSSKIDNRRTRSVDPAGQQKKERQGQASSSLQPSTVPPPPPPPESSDAYLGHRRRSSPTSPRTPKQANARPQSAPSPRQSAPIPPPKCMKNSSDLHKFIMGNADRIRSSFEQMDSPRTARCTATWAPATPRRQIHIVSSSQPMGVSSPLAAKKPTAELDYRSKLLEVYSTQSATGREWSGNTVPRPQSARDRSSTSTSSAVLSPGERARLCPRYQKHEHPPKRLGFTGVKPVPVAVHPTRFAIQAPCPSAFTKVPT